MEIDNEDNEGFLPIAVLRAKKRKACPSDIEMRTAIVKATGIPHFASKSTKEVKTKYAKLLKGTEEYGQLMDEQRAIKARLARAEKELNANRTSIANLNTLHVELPLTEEERKEVEKQVCRDTPTILSAEVCLLPCLSSR